jgi:hypothetical protein
MRALAILSALRAPSDGNKEWGRLIAVLQTQLERDLQDGLLPPSEIRRVQAAVIQSHKATDTRSKPICYAGSWTGSDRTASADWVERARAACAKPPDANKLEWDIPLEGRSARCVCSSFTPQPGGAPSD